MTEDSIEKRALKWSCSGKTGVSSKAILGVMTGNPPSSRFCYPHDGGDLERCLVLLALIPEWKLRLHEMGQIGPEWAALVDHWTELEAMHLKDDKRLYDRMKQILDPIENTNPNLVKLGKGAAIHFGK